jgi:hypothetical protein
MANTPGPGVRIYMQEEDFKALLDYLEETDWDHPVRWKIRAKWAEHQRQQDRAMARTNLVTSGARSPRRKT